MGLDNVIVGGSNGAEWNDDKGSHGRLGLIENVIFTTGDVQLYLVAYKNEANSTERTQLGLVYPATGNPYAFCPTPATNDKSTKIATTDFVNNQIYAPIGCIMYYAGTGTPNFWKLCDGSAISRTDYATLYSIIGTRYGSGNGSTTFNLPDLTNKFIEGSNSAGTEKEAGLPNITGDISGYYNYQGTHSHVQNGALFVNELFGNVTSASGGDYNCGLGFDASRSSSIYGNSTTVQPPSIKVIISMKY